MCNDFASARPARLSIGEVLVEGLFRREALVESSGDFQTAHHRDYADSSLAALSRSLTDKVPLCALNFLNALDERVPVPSHGKWQNQTTNATVRRNQLPDHFVPVNLLLSRLICN